MIIHDVIASSNYNNYFGGFLNIVNSESVIIDSLIAYNNFANKGGAIYIGNSNVSIDKSDIILNSAEDLGGGIYLDNTSQYPQFQNSIFWGNTAGDDIDQIHRANGVLDVSYSDVQGGYTGEGNIDADPNFTDPENDDYTLQWPSPCINTGNPSSVYNDADGTRNDMGAFGGPEGNWWPHNF